jgi:hypothetical protein
MRCEETIAKGGVTMHDLDCEFFVVHLEDGSALVGYRKPELLGPGTALQRFRVKGCGVPSGIGDDPVRVENLAWLLQSIRADGFTVSAAA